MVRMGSGTDGIESPMIRLALVSGGIGSPMPSLKSAKLVSILYRYQLSTTFSTTEGPRLNLCTKLENRFAARVTIGSSLRHNISLSSKAIGLIQNYHYLIVDIC
jgi:hypothetical protein